ncbi:MAG: hypothetical protein LBU04_05935 [Christensenellaceae bacterium]|jgi:hypothetical protein|nr:hypothetical protein [Christensenellaceae bacterium]
MPCNNIKGYASTTEAMGTEKVCIRVQRVFDACISQLTQENAVVHVDFQSQAITFVGGQSSGHGVISNVVITPQANNICSRIQYAVTIPVQITALDASGIQVYGTTSVVINRDIMLKIPKEAIVPTEVQITTALRCVQGVLTGNTLNMVYCATIITKIVAEVELLVQSAGYPALPNCQEYTDNACSGVFTMPIYPR